MIRLQLHQATYQATPESNSGMLVCRLHDGTQEHMVNVPVLSTAGAQSLSLDTLLDTLFHGDTEALSRMRQWMLFALTGMPLPSGAFVDIHITTST